MAEYPLPAWLNQPTDTATQFSRGLTIGAQIQEETNRMAMQAQEMSMQAEIAQRRIEQQSIHDRQQIEVARAYNESRLALDKQKLDAAAAVNNAKTMDAARKFAAQQIYQQRVMGGEDAARVGLELGPSMGMSMGGMASLYKATIPKPAMGSPEVANFGGQEFLKVPHPDGSFGYQRIPAKPVTPEGDIQVRQVIDEKGKPIADTYGYFGTGGTPVIRRLANNRYQILKDQVNRMETSYKRELDNEKPNSMWSKEKQKDFMENVLPTYKKRRQEMEAIADEVINPGKAEAPKSVSKKTDEVRMSEELENARKAIREHKVPRAAVAKKFKERTGMDLPDDIK